MDWQNIIDFGKLYYASSESDEQLRTWPLKLLTCDISWYESIPLEKIDSVICSILSINGGTMLESELAEILGFTVQDDFVSTPPKYRDDAELHVFKGIIRSVKTWGLITSTTEDNTTSYSLTHIGERAIKEGVKYIFYKGIMSLYENIGFNYQSESYNELFPFKESLGLLNSVSNKNKLDYSKIGPEDFIIDESQLTERSLSQSENIYNITSSKIITRYTHTSCQVDIRIYSYEGNLYPIIFYQNQLSKAPTTLINSDYNKNIKDIQVEWGQYLHLLKDDNATLNYESLSPFFDILSLGDFLHDTRLEWGDEKLFKYIKEQATANEWISISSACPANIIERYLSETNNWDWPTISKRVSTQFLIDHINDFHWDYSSISHREDLDKDVVVKLLNNVNNTYADWDWDCIMPLLDIQYIIDNIERVDFDLRDFTKNEVETAISLIIAHPGKTWDWGYISANYNLEFILNYIELFEVIDSEGNRHNRLNLYKIISRAFRDPYYSDLFCKSIEFKNIILNSKSSFYSFSANDWQLIWSKPVIHLFESLKFISWESGRYTSGFECNPYIVWDYEFFNEFHNKITTPLGYTCVSSRISNPSIVSDFRDFNWDWRALSQNINLISQEDYIRSNLDKLVLEECLKIHESNFIESLFDNDNLVEFLTNDLVWKLVSEKVSIEFIRKHLSYDWNWSVLTRRFYNSIKVQALGNDKWKDKWDWEFLTHSLSREVVISHIFDFQDKWDWNFITREFDKEFILNHLANFIEYWNWEDLLTKRITKEELKFSSYLPTIGTCLSELSPETKETCWEIITAKFTYEELYELINTTHKLKLQELFNWNYLDFYNREQFYLREYISDWSELVDWQALSKCNKVHDEFTWDRSLFSEKVWLRDTISLLKNPEYHWDFKALSQIKGLNSTYAIISTRSHAWDWEYLTEFSPLFRKGEHFKQNFKKFSKYISFDKLSYRTDTGVTESTIRMSSDSQWNWSALSSNKSIKFSICFIKEFKDKDWDWLVLSKRADLCLDNQSLYELSDKNWSWLDLSNRDDLVYNEEFITKLIDKPLDWYRLSGLDNFIPNAVSLSKLKGKNLDWDAISANSNLTKSILWDYKDSLNWKLVTRNICDYADIEYLDKFQSYLDWSVISKSKAFVITNDTLSKFKDCLVWADINNRDDFKYTTETILLFSDYIDWSNASESLDIEFTEELIEKFREKWNWNLLRKNDRILEHLNDHLYKYKSELNCANFIDCFDKQPYIYHFTHLFNAIEIIRNRKIQSRNLAKGKFANAAGLNVNIRDTAHSFARFYYRTQTPTQFYNECLGMDSESGYWKEWYYNGYHSKWVSYYSQALNNGLPKCPMPVFFKFNLSEVIAKYPDKCYYSTGNMQTSWAEVVKVSDDPTRLNTLHLYSTIKSGTDIYKTYSQQEFLVLNELDFSDITSLEIICYDEAQANILRNQLAGDPICEKITSESYGVYHRDNRELTIFEEENKICITSGYRDNASLVIYGKGLEDIEILNPENIKKETSSSISSYPSIEFSKTDQPIEVHFVDERGRDWLVYKN